ncbi:c-type cytochrome [Sphingorhabdus arenilitoris]
MLTLSACGQKDGGSGSADVAAVSGETVFKRCAACHSIEKGGANGLGPNLHGIVGRKIASVPGFSYSQALANKGGIWDEAALDAYIESPARAVAGTRMAFSGVRSAEERKALIAYLSELK